MNYYYLVGLLVVLISFGAIGHVAAVREKQKEERQVKILLVNKNKDRLYTHAEQFRVFDDWEAAIAEASKLGWVDVGTFIEIDKKPGMANIQRGGHVDLLLMAVKEE